MPYRQLNSKQLDILLALYKFRFGTRILISQYQASSFAYTHYRLNNLLEQKYIGRKYDGKDKIQGKQAVYYLLPDGIRLLKQNKQLDLSHKSLDLMYKDKQASDQFIERCLDVFTLYTKLSELYLKDLTFYSKPELMDYDFFPKSLPDGFFLIEDKTYWIEKIYSSHTYASIKRKLGNIVKHFQSGEWDTSGMAVPIILLICETPYLEKQVQGLARKQLYKYEEDELAFLTTTKKSFDNIPDNKAPIWTNSNENEELLTLT